ncbi:MAG: nuclear transport factor 2 family protein [Acidobacteriota bacterium]|nr:nuclear transport factor 2 family protein [Acidobacteriota bacterium]
MTPLTRITSCVAVLCLCATLVVAQDTTQTQTTAQPPNTPQTQTNTPQTQDTPQTQVTPQTQTAPQDAKQAERARKEKETLDKQAAKDAQREAKTDAKSQSAAGAQVSSGAAEQAVGQLHNESFQAILRADTTVLDRVWADDYSLTNPGGNVMAKAAFIGALKSGGLKFETLDLSDTNVRVYGDTAVVTGRATVKAKGDNQDIAEQVRYISVYVKRQGQWQAVAMQTTRIGQQ